MGKISLLEDTLKDRLGECMGTSDWIVVTQDLINGFAGVTGNSQWVLDPEQTGEQTHFGGPIAHALLILSLAIRLVHEMLDFSSVRFVVNYGCDKVRFISPVPVGAQIRAHVTPRAVFRRSSSEVVVTVACETEMKEARPAMLAQLLLLTNQ